MKRVTILLTCFLVIATALHAQKKQSKFFTELAVGPSFPIGRFASTVFEPYSNNKAGYAKPGLGVQLSVGYYLNKSIGLLLQSTINAMAGIGMNL